MNKVYFAGVVGMALVAAACAEPEQSTDPWDGPTTGEVKAEVVVGTNDLKTVPCFSQESGIPFFGDATFKYVAPDGKECLGTLVSKSGKAVVPTACFTSQAGPGSATFRFFTGPECLSAGIENTTPTSTTEIIGVDATNGFLLVQLSPNPTTPTAFRPMKLGVGGQSALAAPTDPIIALSYAGTLRGTRVDGACSVSGWSGFAGLSDCDAAEPYTPGSPIMFNFGSAAPAIPGRITGFLTGPNAGGTANKVVALKALTQPGGLLSGIISAGDFVP